MDFQPYFSRLVPGLAVLLALGHAFAAEASRELDYPKEWVFGAAKRFILTQFSKASEPVSKVIPLEDQTAGIIRFVYKDDRFTEPAATLELSELDGDRCKVKLTLPSDYSGRTELLLGKLADASGKELAPSNKEPLPFDSSRVYQSALRFILKKFVGAKQKKEDVLKTAVADAGLIRFAFKRGSFSDSDVRVEVYSLGKGASRLTVSFSSSVSSQQILFEDEMTAAIKDDLGGEKKTEEKPDESS